MAEGPLAGVRVLDLTRLLPGGYGLGLLADLGAQVIKVEQPGVGDYMRWAEPRLGAESAASWITDRNKRSVSLDLKDPRGAEALRRLAATADALVEGFRPGVMDRLGLGQAALRALSPRLVVCSISGYGQDGPLAAVAGHDVNYIGRAGILSITGSREGGPAIPGVQVADLGGALVAMVGLLAALLRARATGEGDHVDVSMTDAAFSLISVHVGEHLVRGGVPPGPEGMLLNGAFPAYNVYRCADGRFLSVGALEPRFFSALCEAVARPDLLATAFDPGALPAWRRVFGARARDEWLELLGQADACVGPVNDLDEACGDAQLRHREMLVELEHPTEGPSPQVGVPIRLARRPGGVRTPAPRLGQHTRAHLAEVGYGEEEIAALIADGVAAEPER